MMTNLDKISTAELIAELNKRNLTVFPKDLPHEYIPTPAYLREPLGTEGVPEL